MTWDAGSSTNAAAWASLSTKLKNLCGTTGAEAWEFVENIPAGTGALQSGSASYSCDVFRCNGTNTKLSPVSTVNKLNAANTTDASSFVFAGVGALNANKVYTLAVINTKATLADSPTTVTLDGSNAPTFSLISTQVGGDGTGIIKVSIYLAKSGGSAPTGTNLTVNFGGTQTCCLAILDEWTGLDNTLATSGVDATGSSQVAVQIVGANGTTATAQAVTLAAMHSNKSIIYQVAGETASTQTYTTQSGWVATAATVQGTTPNCAAMAQVKQDNESVTGTLTLSGAGTSFATLGIELQRSTYTASSTVLNDAGIDWYFVIQIPVPDGAVTSSTCVFERYNSGYKYFSSPCANPGGNLPVGSGYWRILNWYSYANVTAINQQAHQALNTSGFNYWVKFTNNIVIIATRVGANERANGAMILDSFITNTSDMPLMSFAPSSGNNSECTFCRLPGVVVVPASTAWGVSLRSWTRPPSEANTSNTVNSTDLWASGKIHVSRVFVIHTPGMTAGAGGAYDNGYARGLMKSDILCISVGGTVQLGDTMTITGNTWTVIAKNTSYIFLTRAN